MLNNLPISELTEDQDYPKEILYLHGILKGSQVGPVAGLGFGLVLGGLRKSWRPVKDGTAFGLVAGPIIVSAIVFNQMRGRDYVEWQDRAWRLQRNEKQVLVDYLATGGALMGGICGSRLLLRSGTLSGMAFGSLLGMFLFTVSKHVDLSNLIKS